MPGAGLVTIAISLILSFATVGGSARRDTAAIAAEHPGTGARSFTCNSTLFLL